MTIISRETCCACGTDNSGQPVHPLSAASWPLKTCRQCHLVYLTRVPDYQTTGTEFAFEKTAQAESVRRDQARPLERRLSNALKWFRSKVMKRNRALAMTLKPLKHAHPSDTTSCPSPSPSDFPPATTCGWCCKPPDRRSPDRL